MHIHHGGRSGMARRIDVASNFLAIKRSHGQNETYGLQSFQSRAYTEFAQGM
jgi:hypothetical protein